MKTVQIRNLRDRAAHIIIYLYLHQLFSLLSLRYLNVRRTGILLTSCLTELCHLRLSDRHLVSYAHHFATPLVTTGRRCRENDK